MKFYNIYHKIKDDAKLAMTSFWTPGDHPMRSHILELLEREPVLQPPVFQSTFPWKTTQDNDWQQLLDPKLLQLMDRTPYTHQVESFRETRNGNSIVVTSGTGSGKTECFMYPVMNDIYQHRNDGGVQAIFLYPLNALMEDQRSRMAKFCNHLGLNYAVYNGNTEENSIDGVNNNGQEIITRTGIRNNPPHVLLTNPSMMEYILVRDDDRSIMLQSNRLKWIIIDEAHTYSGSSAVELGYQIRRVLKAFNKTVDDVQFACTSATIGNENDNAQLISFISHLTGQHPNRIRVINGYRQIPAIKREELHRILPNMDSDRVLALREGINNRPGMTLTDIWNALYGNMDGYTIEEALNIIDTLCETKVGDAPVLSLRAHYFMRTINGLYTCVNPECNNAERPLTPIGRLTTYQSSRCSCGAPLLEVKQCKRCGTFEVCGKYNNNTRVISAEDYINNERTEEYADYEDYEYDDDGNGNANGNGRVTNIDNQNLSSFALAVYYNGYGRPRANNFTALRCNIISADNDGSIQWVPNLNNGTWVSSKNSNRDDVCPICSRNASKLYSFRAAAKQMNTWIAPILLSESDAGNGLFGKYIAFTDSRQGTAISAKLFNSNAERTYVWNRIVRMLTEWRLNGDTSVSMNDISECFLTDRYYLHRKVNIDTPDDRIAYKKALMRSLIGRRTVYEPSIESLGVISLDYPLLRNVERPNQLLEGTQYENIITSNEWQNFLKICIDYYVRFGNHLQSLADGEDSYLRDSDKSTPINRERWPQVKVNNDGVSEFQPRLVLLLCAALGFHSIHDLQTEQNRNFVNNLLSAARKDLTEIGMLRKVIRGEGYDDYIDYLFFDLFRSRVRVQLNHNNWVCPVTHMFLDTVFCGYSPSMVGYLNPTNIQRYHINDEQVEMPVLQSANINEIPQWLDNNEQIKNLKERGLWSNLHEQMYHCYEPYLTAEHSAQINRDILRDYTQQFKDNELNVLNCSTTMELGVNIGDIDVVLMDTVPPTAANYMQRAGRAGRAKQTKAIAFSMCNNTPIGVKAFSNPMWAIEASNPTRNVLPSETIIQRHVNAFFFRECFVSGRNVNDKVADFFDAQSYNDFVDFLKTTAQNQNSIITSFQEIFDGQNFQNAIASTLRSIENIKSEYDEIIKQIKAAYDAVIATKGTIIRRKAIRNQLDALRSKNLLMFLSEKLFIPNANMPTGICTFDYSTSSEINSRNKWYSKIKQWRIERSETNDSIRKDALTESIEKGERELKKLERQASRDLRTALNEYAPGQWIVIKERNYLSEAVMFWNEHDEQTYRHFYYRCSHCGKVYYDVTEPTAIRCCECGNALNGNVLGDNNLTYVRIYEPIGFKTDPLTKRQGNQANKADKKYFQIETDLLNVDWNHSNNQVPMCELACNNGRGEILYYNKGLGRGFAVCNCGRAVVMPFNNELPNSLRNHKSLGNSNHQCPDNNIRRNVVLGGRMVTDYVVIRFKDQNGAWMNDKEFTISMGVILRRALTQVLGVDNDEVDFGWKHDDNGYMLYLFDTNRGGSNYSIQMVDSNFCVDVFRTALQLLEGYGCDCHNQGDTACTTCLIDRSSQRLAANLSKAKVMNWLRIQNQFTAPISDNIANYSQGARLSMLDATSVAQNATNDGEINEVTFCFTGQDIDPMQWLSRGQRFGRIVNNLISSGKTVNFVVEYDPTIHKSVQTMLPFYNLAIQCRANIHLIAVPNLGEFKTAIVTKGVTGIKRYFIGNHGIIDLNENWGQGATLYYDNVQPDWGDTVALPTMNDLTAALQPNSFIVCGFIDSYDPIRIDHLFQDGILEAIRLNNHQMDRLKSILEGHDVRIDFSDRFVCSPLACFMLVYLIKELRDNYHFKINSLDFHLSYKFDNDRCNRYSNIYFDFYDADDRDYELIELSRRVLGIEPQIGSTLRQHHRSLQLVNEYNQFVEIRPDHSIAGGWSNINNECHSDIRLLDGRIQIKRKRDDDILYYLLIGTL